MNIALVLAGGCGSRVGGECPKQYIEVESKPVIEYCMETLYTIAEIDMIWIVAEEQWRTLLRNSVAADKIRGFSLPGKTRQLSIWNAMRDINPIVFDSEKHASNAEKPLILIHDAARPLVTAKLIKQCFYAVKGHDGVMPVLPMKDTVYFSHDGKSISSLIDRSQIYAGQAPEVFDFYQYYEANSSLSQEQILKINGSTEPAVMYGMDIAMIPGEEGNFKITTMEDLNRFKDIISNKSIGDKIISNKSIGDKIIGDRIINDNDRED